MNYFSQPRGAREIKAKESAIDPKVEPKTETPAAKPAQDILSTFGHGMLVTGNVVCTGALQIFGRVTGEIHAAKVVVCEGAKVEGKIRAQEVVIQGEFLGTVHANSVKLQSTAKVDGEVFNKQLAIEQNALFEGVSRRLERPVEPPTADQVSGVRHTQPPQPPQPVEPLTLTRPINQPIPLSEVII